MARIPKIDDALEAQLRDDPEDVQAHLVYADRLQADGDPRGELIVLQHQLGIAPTPELVRREAAWFERHLVVPRACAVTWRLGLARAMTIKLRRKVPADVLDSLRACGCLTSLEVRVGSAQVVREIVAVAPRSLRAVSIACDVALDAAIVAELVAALPALRQVEVFALQIVGPIAVASPTLVELAVGQRAADPLEVAVEAPLASLVLHAPRVAPATLAAVLARPLKRLGLFVADAPDLLRRLGRAADLEEVGLTWDEALLDDRDRFAASLAALGVRRVMPSPFWSGIDLCQLGQALRDLGRFDDAMRCFERGVVASPKDPDMWLEHGNLLEDVGRKPDSLASFARGARLDPSHAASRYMIARYHRDADSPRAGLGPIRRVCELTPDDPAAWHVRGQLEQSLGKPTTASFKRALELYRKARRAHPGDAQLWFQIACVQQSMGTTRACLDTLAKAIELDPKIKDEARADRDLVELYEAAEFVALTTAPTTAR